MTVQVSIFVFNSPEAMQTYDSAIQGMNSDLNQVDRGVWIWVASACNTQMGLIIRSSLSDPFKSGVLNMMGDYHQGSIQDLNISQKDQPKMYTSLDENGETIKSPTYEILSDNIWIQE